MTVGGEHRGEHTGVHNFTVGQRKGLGVASPSPLYVISIDRESRKVTIGAEQELLRETMRARQLNCASIPGLEAEMRVQAKIRRRHEPAWAALHTLGDDEVEVRFDQPARAVTPGQAAVFYSGDEVVGGGWIV